MFETAAWLIIAGVSLWGFIGWTAWYHERDDRYQHHQKAYVAETSDEDPRPDRQEEVGYVPHDMRSPPADGTEADGGVDR